MHMKIDKTASRLLAIGLATFTLVSGRAEAAPVAPLVPEMRPAKAPELVTRFHDALARGLKSAGVPLVPTATIRTQMKAACATPRCALGALRLLHADQVATCRINTVGKNYAFTLKLLSKTATLASVRGRCDICTLMEALTTAQRLAKKLGQKGSAAIKSVSAIAPGTPKTHTPKTHTPKTHTPKTHTPKTETPPTAETPPTQKTQETRTGRHWPLWPALAAAGVGVLGLAVGIPLLSMDGDFTNCRGPARPDGRNCTDIYSTSGAGWTMTTLGLAGLATAGVLFYFYFTSDPPEKKHAWWRNPNTLSVAPITGGAILGTSGTF